MTEAASTASSRPFFNPIAGAFTPYYNGPWSTCGGPGNGRADPKGALVTEFGARSRCVTRTHRGQAAGFLGLPLETQDRENVMNFHFGIPHKNDAGRDDVQALFYNFAYHQQFGGNIDQQGGLATLNSNLPQWGGTTGIANTIFGLAHTRARTDRTRDSARIRIDRSKRCVWHRHYDSAVFSDTQNLKPGTTFGQNAANAQATRYLSPSQGSYAPGTTIATNNSDTTWNDATIIKLQYQKNFGSSAYVRIMGYSSYSDWLMSNANVAGQSSPDTDTARPVRIIRLRTMNWTRTPVAFGLPASTDQRSRTCSR